MLKAQVLIMWIARVTIYRKVNKKPNSNQDEISNPQIIFSDDQESNESRSNLDF